MVTRMLGQVYKAARNKAASRAKKSVPFIQSTDLQRQILDLLAADQGANRATIVRDVHLRLALPQPQVLRTIRELEQAGHIHVNASLHDPLGSPITLAKPDRE